MMNVAKSAQIRHCPTSYGWISFPSLWFHTFHPAVMKRVSGFFFSILLTASLCFPIVASAQYFQKLNTGALANQVDQSVGVAWGDLNLDGHLDLIITNFWPDLCTFYLNDGTGTFVQQTDVAFTQAAHNAPSPSIGDYDNDGRPDLHIAILDLPNKLFRNVDGSFFDQMLEDEVATVLGDSRSSTWADYNNDGHLDLVVINRFTAANQLFRNNGDGSFSFVGKGPITEDQGNSSTATWADFDMDNDPDLYITNVEDQNNILYINNGDGTFMKDSDDLVSNDGASSAGSSWGDYDNDGDLDLFVANGLNQNNSLYNYDRRKNTFNRVDESIISNDGGFSHGSTWVDFDNDGYLDLFVGNRNNEANFLYQNNGDGTFTRILEDPLVQDKGNPAGIAWADADSDGDLDVLLTDSDTKVGGGNDFFLNAGNDNNWINVRLVGSDSNADGIGAKIAIKTTTGGKPLRQLREVTARDGAYGQSSINAEFGLGDAIGVQKMIVLWPSGKLQIFRQLPANQFITIYEDEPVALLANFTDTATLDALAPTFDAMAKGQNQTIYDGGYQMMRLIGEIGAGGSIGGDFFDSLNDDAIQSIAEENFLPTDFMVSAYPNPAHRQASFTFALPEAAAVSFGVYDMLGREVHRATLAGLQPGNSQLLDMDLSTLMPGVYLYRALFDTAEGRSIIKTGTLNVIR